MRISAVINTFNEEINIKRCIDSLVNWVDEVIVVDMNSVDSTIEIAKKLGAKVFTHEQTGFVEPARNFAIEKAQGKWILIIDADEEIPQSLSAKILTLISGEHGKSFFRIPRKNIIFNKWIKYGRWWPDYQVRLFKKGHVSWFNEIHSIPLTYGVGVNLEANESNSIIHYNYNSVGQFINRLNRYTDVQVQELKEQQHEFKPVDVIRRPLNEFISRYLAGEGYKDGLHGFVLASLQAFSEFVLYLKLWEQTKFRQDNLSLREFNNQADQGYKDMRYWIKEESIKEEQSPLKRIVKRVID